jgi:hypothetical protein
MGPIRSVRRDPLDRRRHNTVKQLRALVYGVGLATRIAGARRRGDTVDIPRLDAHSASLDEVMAARRPVILEGLVGELGLSDIATPDALRQLAGDHHIKVTEFDAARPYFLYSGGYDTRALEQRPMAVRELLETMFDDGVAEGTVVYQLFGINSLNGETANVLDQVNRAVTSRVDLATEPRFSGIWIGSPGAVTPLHHDAWPGLLFQTHGTKRVTMYAPSDRTHLSFRLPLRGEGRWSNLPGRSADASLTEFPALAHARRFVATLTPGDVLHIPAFWAHEMEAETANISMPFRFAGTNATYFNPGFLRPASEMLRKQVRVLTAR